MIFQTARLKAALAIVQSFRYSAIITTETFTGCKDLRQLRGIPRYYYRESNTNDSHVYGNWTDNAIANSYFPNLRQASLNFFCCSKASSSESSFDLSERIIPGENLYVSVDEGRNKRNNCFLSQVRELHLDRITCFKRDGRPIFPYSYLGLTDVETICINPRFIQSSAESIFSLLVGAKHLSTIRMNLGDELDLLQSIITRFKLMESETEEQRRSRAYHNSQFCQDFSKGLGAIVRKFEEASLHHKEHHDGRFLLLDKMFLEIRGDQNNLLSYVCSQMMENDKELYQKLLEKSLLVVVVRARG